MKDIITPINTPDGHFHDGDQSTGALGTIVTAQFQNDVQAGLQSAQAEIIKILKTANPTVVLDPAKTDQLITALKFLFLQSGNNLIEFSNAGATAQQAARTNLGLGSASQRAIGTGTNQVPDMSSFGSLISSAGYQKLPSGLIIQWGMINGTTGQLSGVYPTAFPNAALQAVVSLSDKTSGANAGISVFVEAATFASKTALTVQSRGTDGSGTTSARFIAIGW